MRFYRAFLPPQKSAIYIKSNQFYLHVLYPITLPQWALHLYETLFPLTLDLIEEKKQTFNGGKNM